MPEHNVRLMKPSSVDITGPRTERTRSDGGEGVGPTAAERAPALNPQPITSLPHDGQPVAVIDIRTGKVRE